MPQAAKTSLNEWLGWMQTLHPNEIELGLDRVRQVASSLDLLSFEIPVVTIAGTNGKGSCVHALSELLQSEGRRVGTYTSPHIQSYNERICIAGQLASDVQICAAFEQINETRGETSLTYFEFGTLAALLLFKQHTLDVIILEVGLGGRLDAVNIVDPDICVITSIGIDHEHWLGSDRETIGAEKAGILRSGRPFICVDTDIPNSIRQASEKNKCEEYFLGDTLNLNSKHTQKRNAANDVLTSISFESVARKPLNITLNNAQLPETSLLAAAQVHQLLSPQIALGTVQTVLSSAHLSGRFELIQVAGQTFILDVAHNPQAVAKLANSLQQKGFPKVVAVLAAMSDKDIKGIKSAIAAQVDTWVCTQIPDLPRAMPADELFNLVKENNERVQAIEDPLEAFFTASEIASMQRPSATKQPILVLGSFYLVSEFKSRFLPEVNVNE